MQVFRKSRNKCSTFHWETRCWETRSFHFLFMIQKKIGNIRPWLLSWLPVGPKDKNPNVNRHFLKSIPELLHLMLFWSTRLTCPDELGHLQQHHRCHRTHQTALRSWPTAAEERRWSLWIPNNKTIPTDMPSESQEKLEFTYSVKPIRIKGLLVASFHSTNTPLSSLCTLRVLPLRFNSFLETMEVGSSDQLAGLEDIVEQAIRHRQKKNIISTAPEGEFGLNQALTASITPPYPTKAAAPNPRRRLGRRKRWKRERNRTR